MVFKEKPKPKAVILTGPTGSGKSSLAVGAAEILGGQIINADSLAFYRGLDIGTAKPDPTDQKRVPHHLFDILEPDEPFDAAQYLALARPIVQKLFMEGKPPFIVGGTGLYLRSLTKGLFYGPGRQDEIRGEINELARNGADLYVLLSLEDPAAAAKINPNDFVRIQRALEVIRVTGRSIVDFQKQHSLADRPFETLVLVIDVPAGDLDQRLLLRTKSMFDRGLVEETKSILAKGFEPGSKPLQAIGYREVQAYLAGEMTLAETMEKVYLRTRQLAKRQRTWFRGQVPEGIWVKPDLSLITELAGDFWAESRD